MNREHFKVLIVDDEKSFSLLLSRILNDEGYSVKSASGAQEALKIIDGYEPDLIITDLKMPGMDGITMMRGVREKYPETDFIMITAYATVETAVSAMKMGALDYITKPLNDPEELRQAVLRAFEKSSLTSENKALRQEIFGDLPPLDIIFAGIGDVFEEIKAVASTDTTVILYGETGTGKSLIAKVLHMTSGRKGPFVTINCASIPENLLESELFGYEKGAFTGALRSKKGRFELANEGTIFLDEISEMSGSLQAKLLRVLQDRCFERLGGLETIRTSARVVTATNRDLKEMIRDNRFREDLYYRVNVFPVHIPPLRERKDRIPMFSEYLVKKLSQKIGKSIREIPPESVENLMSYYWYGNMRELENTIEKAIILSRDGRLLIPRPDYVQEESCTGDMKDVEKRAIESALKRTKGNRKEAAEILGISLRSLHYKIKEYGIVL
jgi:two-component system, NtrC family, response regulator AtoC